MMDYQREWDEITTDPRWAEKPDQEKQQWARRFAQKVVRPTVGSGSDPRVKDFIAKNTRGVKVDAPSHWQSFKDGAKNSAVGMIARRKLPDEQMGVIDSMKEVWNGGNSLVGDGSLHGYAAMLGGVAPDMVLGGVAASAAKAALLKAGASAGAATVGASVGTGAAVPAGAVKYAGGTNEQAATAGVAGAVGGVLPFASAAAKKVPAGGWNFHVGGKKAPPPPPPGGQQQAPPPGGGPKTPPPPPGSGQAPPGGWRSQPPPPPGAGPKPPPSGGPQRPPKPAGDNWRWDDILGWYQPKGRPKAPPPPGGQQTPPGGQSWSQQPPPGAGPKTPPPGVGPRVAPPEPPPSSGSQRVPFDDEATAAFTKYKGQKDEYISARENEVAAAREQLKTVAGKPKIEEKISKYISDLENDIRLRRQEADDAATNFTKEWDHWNTTGKRGARPGFIKWGVIADAAAKGAFKVAGLGAEGVRRTWKAGGTGSTLAAKGINALTPEVIPAKIERNSLIPGGQMLHQMSEDLGINDATRAIGRGIDKAMVTPLTPEVAAPFVGDAASGVVSSGANALRRGLVSGYGVPDEVHQRFVRESPANAREIFRPTTELFNEMAKKPTGEQFDLHYQATEPSYKGPLAPDAQRIQDDNLRVSEEMLRLGVITQQEFDRWAKYHLPREYAKHEATNGQVFRTGRRNRTKVDVPGGRGTTERMSENEMLAQQASGIPWEPLGPADATGNVTAWRDYTPEERAQWGEHRNLGRAGAKKIAQGEANAAAADFLNWVARRPDYARSPDQVLPGIVEGPHPETLTDPDGTVWKLMPNTAAGPGRGRVRKYGNLAGMYVKKDVHDYVYDQMELETIIPTLEKFSGANWWKKAMTIGNVPGYFINNVGHNIPMLLTNGGAVSDIPGALLAMTSDDDQVVRNLIRQGYIKNDGMKREMAANLAKAMRNKYGEDIPPGPLSFTRAMMEAADTYHAAEGGLYELAQVTDDAFRVALVKRLMEDGVHYEEAAQRMNRVFYNPQNVTAPIPRIISSMPAGPAFAKVNWYLTDAMTQTAVNNPVRAAEMVGLYKLMPILLGLAAGLSIEEIERQRKALPPHMQPTGNALPLGKQGGMTEQDHWWGTGAFNPSQNGMANPNAAIPGVPRGLQPSGPWKVAYDLFISNYDPNIGKMITERDSQGNIIGGSLMQGTPLEDSIVDPSNNAMDYASRNLLPGSIDKARRFGDAMQGKVTPRGDIIEPFVAAERMAGLQVQPVDTENAARMSAVMGKNDSDKYRAKAIQLTIAAVKARKNGDIEQAEKWEAEAERMIEQMKQAAEAGAERSRELTPSTPKNSLLQ